MRRHLPVVALALLSLAVPAPSRAADPPRTAFEESGGASWTTPEEELAFLAAVDAASDRVRVEVIGSTTEDRPMHLVVIGEPAPRTAAQARTQPVELHICTQHGNEPAGREACLIALRDLAFSEDAEVVAQLERQTFLFVPTANPDGRAANSRENAEGVDVNRDHLNLTSPEARAIAKVVRDWQPDIAIDHHEYGPGEPVLYDDDVLYLWPRNLNVDDAVHDLGVSFSKEVLAPCLAEAGFTSDEYGIDAVGSTDVQQTAGGGDEGILRNAAGLRHVVGILVESAVSMDATNVPDEATTAGVQLRRVESHRTTIGCTLGFTAASSSELTAATSAAPARKTEEGRTQSAPVYFSGQDEDTTLSGNGDPEVAVDAPCAYDLTAAQYADVRDILDLQGIASVPAGGGRRVTMAQPAEPVIPLLLDARNDDRAETDATPLTTCAGGGEGGGGGSGGGSGGTGGGSGGGAGGGTGGGSTPATGAPYGLAVAAVVAVAVVCGLRRATA
ncbi:MAG TPA: M14 family metallopeptidase [Frankiaceae bacterium]|jgi:uncharacterized membrane protein YgcG|nr:M14 family metallopeptidase [Frankiaceae bacterium]